MATSSGSDHTGRPRAYTPPKGRPTRGRDRAAVRRRLFGPVAQWVAVAILFVVAVLLVVWLTDGGVFNPFDTGTHILSPIGAWAGFR